MSIIYDRETLFQKNVVDGVQEYDLSSIDLGDLTRNIILEWTIVKQNERARPDIISYRLYGTADLWWIVLWVNGISDPWNDLMPDVALKYVPKSRIDDALKYFRKKQAKLKSE
jgi:hypothetical protein